MPTIQLTEKAAQKLYEFKQKEATPAEGLRIWVSSGGCSGYSYGMAFDNKKDEDVVIESNGVKILIDKFSLKFLDGSEIDYVETLEGSGFKINNPNVRSSCACGQSFEV